MCVSGVLGRYPNRGSTRTLNNVIGFEIRLGRGVCIENHMRSHACRVPPCGVLKNQKREQITPQARPYTQLNVCHALGWHGEAFVDPARHPLCQFWAAAPEFARDDSSRVEIGLHEYSEERRSCDVCTWRAR